jgi:hypothetical protein
MHSLVFDEHDPLYQETLNLIAQAPAGTTVRIQIRPKYIIVEYQPQHGFTLSEEEKIPNIQPLNDGFVCVPIPNNNTSINKLASALVGDNGHYQNISYYISSVELLFACTFEKAQGKTLRRVLLFIHWNPWKQATLPQLYVAFTRVTSGANIRVWPSRRLNLDRFLSLKHDLALVLLDSAYRDDGTFSADLYRANHAIHLAAQEETLRARRGSTAAARNQPAAAAAAAATTTAGGEGVATPNKTAAKGSPSTPHIYHCLVIQ